MEQSQVITIKRLSLDYTWYGPGVVTVDGLGDHLSLESYSSQHGFYPHYSPKPVQYYVPYGILPNWDTNNGRLLFNKIIRPFQKGLVSTRSYEDISSSSRRQGLLEVNNSTAVTITVGSLLQPSKEYSVTGYCLPLVAVRK